MDKNSKKSISLGKLLTGLLAIVVIVAVGIMYATRPQVEEDAPPSLELGSALFQGFSRSSNNLITVTQSDVDNYEGAPCADPITIGPGRTVLYTDHATNLGQILQATDSYAVPVLDNQYQVTFWSPGQTVLNRERAFHLYPKWRYEGEQIIEIQDPFSFEILPYQAFWLSTRYETQICNVHSGDEIPNITELNIPLESNESGWLLLATPNCQALASHADDIRSVWSLLATPQTDSSGREIQNLKMEDFSNECTTSNSQIVWVNFRSGPGEEAEPPEEPPEEPPGPAVASHSVNPASFDPTAGETVVVAFTPAEIGKYLLTIKDSEGNITHSDTIDIDQSQLNVEQQLSWNGRTKPPESNPQAKTVPYPDGEYSYLIRHESITGDGQGTFAIARQEIAFTDLHTIRSEIAEGTKHIINNQELQPNDKNELFFTFAVTRPNTTVNFELTDGGGEVLYEDFILATEANKLESFAWKGLTEDNKAYPIDKYYYDLYIEQDGKILDSTSGNFDIIYSQNFHEAPADPEPTKFVRPPAEYGTQPWVAQNHQVFNPKYHKLGMQFNYLIDSPAKMRFVIHQGEFTSVSSTRVYAEEKQITQTMVDEAKFLSFKWDGTDSSGTESLITPGKYTWEMNILGQDDSESTKFGSFYITDSDILTLQERTASVMDPYDIEADSSKFSFIGVNAALLQATQIPSKCDVSKSEECYVVIQLDTSDFQDNSSDEKPDKMTISFQPKNLSVKTVNLDGLNLQFGAELEFKDLGGVYTTSQVFPVEFIGSDGKLHGVKYYDLNFEL